MLFTIKRQHILPSCALFLAFVLTLLVATRCSALPGMAQDTGCDPAEVQVPVLMYHHLLQKEEARRYAGNDIVTYTEDFSRQLQWLKKNGFETISTAQLIAFLYDNAPLPARPVMLTFDDGYLGNARYAAPLLREYGYTAVLFSVTGKIGDSPAAFHPDAIQMLDAQTMDEIADVFEFASHTHDLHRATGKGRSALTDATKAERTADLEASLHRLSTVKNATPLVFSYPYGFYSSAVQEDLKQQGVRIAFRATAGTLTRRSDPYSLPRFPVSFAVSMETFKSYFADILNK